MDHPTDDLYSLSEEVDVKDLSPAPSDFSPTLSDFSPTLSSNSQIHHDDSGYGVELNVEHGGSVTTGDSGALDEQSVSTLSRGQRARKSLRNLRVRTGKFIEHRIRPSCLGQGMKSELDRNSRTTTTTMSMRMKSVVSKSKSDNAPNIAKISGSVRSNLKDEVDKMVPASAGLGRRSRYQSSPAVRSPLERQEELDLVGSVDSKREMFGCRSMRSSNSAGTLHSVDDRGMLWMNSTMNSTTESRQSSPATSTEVSVRGVLCI